MVFEGFKLGEFSKCGVMLCAGAADTRIRGLGHARARGRGVVVGVRVAARGELWHDIVSIVGGGSERENGGREGRADSDDPGRKVPHGVLQALAAEVTEVANAARICVGRFAGRGVGSVRGLGNDADEAVKR